MEICIIFPTRGRPQKSVETLKKYIQFASNLSKLKVIVSVDEDDQTVKIDSYTSIHPCITVISGPPKGKIGAINRDVPDPSTWDILLLASDDMIPVVKGYDERIRTEMNTHFPDTDGVLFFNDGYQKYKLNTLVICGSAYYKRFGYIYNPEYKSFFCDNEFMDEANLLGRQTYIHDTIIKHEHPANTISVKYDTLYSKNQSDWENDQQIYSKYIQKTIDLSVLICTIPSRVTLFVSLLNRIAKLKQTTSLRVEVLFDDDMTITIGEKRQRLLNKARGKYCCFIDDDDEITDEYFKVIEESGLSYDCIQLNGMMYRDGVQHSPFYHSIIYPSWVDGKDAFYRPPNHLNPVRTSISKQIGFVSKNYFEDRDFSSRLLSSGLLKTEYSHTTLQYRYMFSTTNNSIPKNVYTLGVKQTLSKFIKR